MTNAIRMDKFGGPEVLQYREVEVGKPGPGQVRVAHTAIGLNMIDTYFRSGLYPLALPSGLGSEAAGVVVATGEGVSGIETGQRVAYASPAPLDGYAEERLIDARWLTVLPDQIDDETGAAMMLKGLTSWYLLKHSYRVKACDWILLYAAAGGVGLIAAQWANQLRARVIGVVGTEKKRGIALAHGCEHVLLANDDIVGTVRELTHGEGVAAVYDSVGRETFYQSLDCLRRHGVMVSFGNASGAVEPFAPLELAKRGSLYVTRPTLWDFVGERADLERGSAELIEAVTSKLIRIEIRQRYPLAEAAAAQIDLEQRVTTGSTVLLP
ncbi:quinone oxidoreductase family protein [Candidatus Rariloculus sp.]|uniref:quinone oxidoreductase family protein n=1 Tax=Candidatus Rariloculus sp. TaxID=3101265 RepID=UPI003D13555A